MKRCRKLSQRAEKDTVVSSSQSPNKKRAESAVVSLASASANSVVTIKRSSSSVLSAEERATKRLNMEKATMVAAMTGSLSEDVYKNMDKTGRSEFLKHIKQQLKDANDPLFDNNKQFKMEISSAIYDLFWQTINGNVKKETSIAILSEVVSLHDELSSIILDIVNILDAETSTTAETMPEKREVLAALLKNLDRVVSEKLIKERLEMDSLQEFGIVKQKMFYSKFIKIKTKLYYKQRRFNLFREESEGYAKLITELNVDFEEEATPESIMDIIKSLIGCFNLDPNRVLDIIIESFESRPYLWHIFIPLIRAYMPTSSIICEVLGYKFRYFVEINKAPKSLYHVCALLLKYDVIELNDIYVWLSPTDRVIIADWEDSLKQAKEYVRKLNVIITNKDKEPVEPDIEKEYTEEEYGANQKFGLCEALLKVGDWHNAYKIIRKLPEQCVLVHEPIARALCDLVHFSIKQVYSPHCFKALQNAKDKTLQRCKFNDDEKFMQKWQAKGFSDLRNNAFPMVSVLGPSLHLDSVLIFKLIRILRTILSDMGVNTQNTPTPQTEAETLYFEVMNILDAAILPALSYLNCNCPMAEEVMTVLKYFPYHFRYSLYARWKNDTYLLHPKLIRKRGDSQKNIKALMKRVSKENVKPVGRQIGKLSHCSPAFLFDYILLQIQIYDNLIGPVVDSFKYLTTLSFDVLGYCLIEALAMADRNRIKHDGTSISMWLQSLASFCGAIFKKYNIELSGLLQFVANQLKMQKSLDLLILKDIVQKMAGVESAEELTNEQLNALCGGELLRGEAGYFSQVRNTKKSSQRLKDALANNNLAVTICLLMAQQKHCVIYKETTQSHLKLVGKLYDQCQDTLVQFGTFLGSTYSVDEYVERLPSIITMLQEFHINADVAFFLARPMFSHQINQKYDQLRKADANSKKLTTAQKQIKYLEAINYVMNPIIESVRPLHGPKVWEDISPQFLVTFWSLSMYDLQVPADSYQKEILKLKQLSQQVIDSKDNTVSRNKKEQERFMALMEKLQDERKKQQEHVDKTMQRLEHQKDNWFLLRSAKSAKNETITQFLQLCLFPRCTFTALDALYCAKFVHTIHNLKANNFSTLLCYDRIFCDITYSVTSCTENEATRYGRFLCALLETVMRWHADEATFNRECANYPGFVTKFRVSNQFSEANDNVGYENYRHVCHKWHYKITKAIVFCLDSKEYMQIRNALIILMRILPHYPVLFKLGQIIERKVEKVREEEKNKRPDLFVIASSYIGQLKIRSSQMLRESDFHQVADRLARSEALPNYTPNTTINANNITLTNTNNIQNAAGTTSFNVTESTNNNSVNETTTATTTRDSTPTQSTSNVSAQSQQQQTAVNETNQRNTNGDTKIEKREKERNEKPKIIKTTVSSATEKEHHRGNNVPNSLAGTSNNNVSTRNIPLIEIRDDTIITEKERERERFSNRSSLKDFKKDERIRDRERERERYARNDDIADGNVSAPAATGSLAPSRLKRERRREERFRAETPSVIEITESNIVDKHYQEHYEVERARERDFSSVSNESGTSVQRTQEKLDFDKETKRRKVEQSTLLSKKLAAEEAGESNKKERVGKIKERKDKMTDEEKETRKERKLGRKRERQEESTTIAEHKRKREVLNGDDDVRDRTDKYHTRESPHIRDIRERSHEKFDRSERVPRSADERQYAAPKSTRSRINY